MAVAPRRIGAETSATRQLIVDAAKHLIGEEGYASASTRRVAARAGLKPSLVHYYFPTTDDLLLEVSKQGAEESDQMIEDALESGDPLRALWQFFIDTSRTAMAMEFMALANHREPVRKHMAAHSVSMRNRQVEILKRVLGSRLAEENCDPAALAVVLAGVGRAIVLEHGLGVTVGHEEAKALVDEWLGRLAPDQSKRPAESA